MAPWCAQRVSTACYCTTHPAAGGAKVARKCPSFLYKRHGSDMNIIHCFGKRHRKLPCHFSPVTLSLVPLMYIRYEASACGDHTLMSDFSIFYQVPQYLLVGIAEILIRLSMPFPSDSDPKHQRFLCFSTVWSCKCSLLRNVL